MDYDYKIKNSYIDLLHGDCLKRLRRMDDECIDAVVTDPPYELGFIGRKWDKSGIAYSVELWRECLRVLKLGGHLAAFSATRTQHRMVCAIEDAGFDIRDQLNWMFGCLDTDTQALTIEGPKNYTDIRVGDLVSCYDITNGKYSYQPVLEVLEYEYDDTAYRIIGDFGEQVVSRNHRCIVEREGKEIFITAEEAAREFQVCVPILEKVNNLRETFSNTHKGASTQKQNLQFRLQKRVNETKSNWQTLSGLFEIPSKIHQVFSMRKNDATYNQELKKGSKSSMFLHMQWCYTWRAFKEVWAQRSCGLVRRIKYIYCKTNDWFQQSKLEGWYKEGLSLHLCTLSGRIQRDGEGRWVGWSRTQVSNSKGNQFDFESKMGSSSQRPQCTKQQIKESDVVSFQCGSSEIREWYFRKSAMVRVVPFRYVGKVWCLRVPTGAFVAVRKGVVFPTGNSGFPKSLDIAKVIDKSSGHWRGRRGKVTIIKQRSKGTEYEIGKR